MDKQRVINLMNSQIEEIDRKINYMDYDYDNIHETIDYFNEISKLKGSKQTLITVRNIIENMEE